MIVETRTGGNREVRAAAEWGTSAIPRPSAVAGTVTSAGKRVTIEGSLAIPTVLACLRLVATIIASLDIVVYRRVPGGIDVPAPESWQQKLLLAPALDMSSFDWKSDMASQLEGYGNSFAQKIKSGGRVVELLPLDPERVRIRRDKKSGVKMFDIKPPAPIAPINGLTSSDILHIRGFSLRSTLSGLSPILASPEAVGSGLALQEFQGRYFANDTAVGLVMSVPGNPSPKTAARTLATFELSHRSASQHRPALVSGGAKLERLGLGLRESQFIEANQWTVEQLARLIGVPAELVEVAQQRPQPTEQIMLKFHQLYGWPRLQRMSSALEADPDLFVGTNLYPRFDLGGLLRADALTESNITHQKIQDGRLLPDEARAKDGMGPLPPIPEDWEQHPGQVPQITPVGGAPNPIVDDPSLAPPVTG